MAEVEDTPFTRAWRLRLETVSKMAELMQYTLWPNEFKLQEIRAMRDKLFYKIGPIPITGFTESECDKLDFGHWKKEDPLRLIPNWLYLNLMPGEVITSITDKQITIASDYTCKDIRGYIDNDHRFGYLAYGIIPKKDPS